MSCPSACHWSSSRVILSHQHCSCNLHQRLDCPFTVGSFSALYFPMSVAAGVYTHGFIVGLSYFPVLQGRSTWPRSWGGVCTLPFSYLAAVTQGHLSFPWLLALVAGPWLLFLTSPPSPPFLPINIQFVINYCNCNQVGLFC